MLPFQVGADLQFLFDDHVLDVERRELRRAGERIAMEPQVFDLLVHLVRNRDRVLSRRQLEDALYGWGEVVESNAIEVHIHNLRRKLSRTLIQTVRGAGYRLNQDLNAA